MDFFKWVFLENLWALWKVFFVYFIIYVVMLQQDQVVVPLCKLPQLDIMYGFIKKKYFSFEINYNINNWIPDLQILEGNQVTFFFLFSASSIFVCIYHCTHCTFSFFQCFFFILLILFFAILWSVVSKQKLSVPFA